MGLFGNPRKNKDKWAKLVVTNAQPGMRREIFGCSKRIWTLLLYRCCAATASLHMNGILNNTK